MQNKSDQIELSVVMPCLNEADTLEVCIRKAQTAMKDAGIRGEIIIADNGSSDGSQEIAGRCGARVVPVSERGYGAALMGGIQSANGVYVLMGDADDSYDFLELPKFVEKLREGFDLVQGCRLPSGGGTVKKGAMPFTHRWIGNPLFSRLVRRWFQAPIHDVYCGMRGFTKKLYDRLEQRCTGMEFATEMIIKSSLFKVSIAEVPITLHPDGRVAHAPHLKTFRDGWRTLRFFLMYTPRNLFFLPGMLLTGVGVMGYFLALPGVKIGNAHIDVHTLLYASLAILCGVQAVQFSLFTKIFAIHERLMPGDEWVEVWERRLTLERGLFAGGGMLVAGLLLLVRVAMLWISLEFGDLDYAATMRWVIPGTTLTALGVQTIFFSFFLSILGLRRK